MIRVNRGPPAGGFEQRASQLQEKFTRARTKVPGLTAAQFWASVRRDLRNDALELAVRFNLKCAYCESKMRHVMHPHVEHYRPKSQKRFGALMFSWDNWLLSCGICNEEKWADFPEQEGEPMLLDPASEDPRGHIGFRRNLIFASSKRGDETIKLVRLWRRDLERERGFWLLQIDVLLLLAVNGQDPDVRRESRNCLIWAMQDDAPYAAMTRDYLCEVCPALAKPQVPHTTIAGIGVQERIYELVQRYSDDVLRFE